MASSGYPRNLQYVVKRLSGYSRNTFKIQTLNATTAGPGQIVTVDLPSNSLVDLNTLTMFFKGSNSTSAGAAGFPRHIENLIDRLEIEVNGQLLGGGCSYYNQLWNIIADTSFGTDVISRRKVLQNSADLPIGGPTANANKEQFAIHNWLGFLGSVKPSILDTSLLGNVRMRITLAGTNVLELNSGATNPSYTLEDIFFSVDTISLDDGIFYAMHQQFLAAGGVYELPYNNFFSFTSTGGISQSTKFSISTQSLDRTFGTFTWGGSYPTAAVANNVNVDPNTQNVSYFTRLGNNANGGAVTLYGGTGNFTAYTNTLQSCQWSINGVYYPNFKPTPEQIFSLMLNSTGIAQDTLGGNHPLLSSQANWNRGFFVHVQQFNHGTDDYISGIDTRGNIAQGTWETIGSTNAAVTGAGAGPGTNGFQALVFAQTTSLLRVGAGRQLEVVL